MTTQAKTNRAADAQAVWAAMAACFAMIAYQTGSKPVRDAFFLSQFEISSLPLMVIVAAMVSIAAALGAARAMSRFTPVRMVPASFAASALLHFIVWYYSETIPREAAVMVYLLSIAAGSILTSGFWSLLSERFDPFAAKAVVGRVAGAGTVGGMVGGLVAERVAASATLTTMLPVLATDLLVCGMLLLAFGATSPRPAHAGALPLRAQPEASGLAVLRQSPYLKALGALVVLGTMSAAMMDFAFKSAAVAEYGRGAPLLRFLALFYTVTSVLTFLLQTVGSNFALTKLGTARTVATLPFAVTTGGVIALMTAGGLWTTTIARGMESVFRGSLFRAGYEIFFVPMPLHEKRAAKGVVDVAFDRLGEAAGSVVVSLLILVGVPALPAATLAAAVLVSLAGLYAASRLEGAYLNVLEHGMRDRTAEVAEAAATQESLGLTMFGGAMPLGAGAAASLPVDPLLMTGYSDTGGPPTHPTDSPATSDPLVQQFGTLRHGSRNAIRHLLRTEPVTRPELVPQLVALLARDDVAKAVVEALTPLAARHSGQLIDTLLDEATELAIRRRIPRVLRNTARQSVADGLLLGLNDRRFEVRFQCSRTLTELAGRNSLLRFSSAEVLGYIQKEAAVSKPVWESYRLLDQPGDAESSPIFDEVLRDRTSRGLQHLFALLALVLPAEPLRLAYHGLHVDDPHLRGTALEYLSSVLPRETRDRLWPLIAGFNVREARADGRSREQILAELMRADQTIYLRIEELRKRPSEEPDSG